MLKYDYSHCHLFPHGSSRPNFLLTSGRGTSELDPLLAFDSALIDAGISDYNLVKISSILPIRAKLAQEIDALEGSPIWTAYSTVSSNTPETILATTVAVGLPRNRNSVGVIMETSEMMSYEERKLAVDRGHPLFSPKELSEKLEGKIKRMTEVAMENRGLKIKEILTSTACGRVPARLAGSPYFSLISAVCIW